MFDLKQGSSCSPRGILFSVKSRVSWRCELSKSKLLLLLQYDVLASPNHVLKLMIPLIVTDRIGHPEPRTFGGQCVLKCRLHWCSHCFGTIFKVVIVLAIIILWNNGNLNESEAQEHSRDSEHQDSQEFERIQCSHMRVAQMVWLATPKQGRLGINLFRALLSLMLPLFC